MIREGGIMILRCFRETKALDSDDKTEQKLIPNLHNSTTSLKQQLVNTLKTNNESIKLTSAELSFE